MARKWEIISRSYGSKRGHRGSRPVSRDFPKISGNPPMPNGAPFPNLIAAKESPISGGISAHREGRGNGAKIGNRYPLLAAKEGGTWNRQVAHVSPWSWEIGRFHMATHLKIQHRLRIRRIRENVGAAEEDRKWHGEMGKS